MEEKNKSGKGKTITIVVLVIVILGLVGFIAYDKGAFDSFLKKKNEVKEENKKEEKDTKSNKKISIISVDNDKFYKIYEDGTNEEISGLNDAVEPFITDNENLYYFKLNQSDSLYYLYSINLYEEDTKETKYNVSLDDLTMTNEYSIEDGNFYCFSYKDDNYYADTINMTDGKKASNKINLDFVLPESQIINKKIIITDQENAGNEYKAYLYDFQNNELKSLSKQIYGYMSSGDDMLVYRKNDSKYCAYDISNDDYKYCVSNKTIDNGNENNKAIIYDGVIYAINNNKVLECSEEENCSELYTLSDEDKYDDIQLIAFGEKVVLSLGKEVSCKEGCSYSYESYDLKNNKQKIELPLGSNFNLIYVK